MTDEHFSNHAIHHGAQARAYIHVPAPKGVGDGALNFDVDVVGAGVLCGHARPREYTGVPFLERVVSGVSKRHSVARLQLLVEFVLMR